jgi:hypothetical protein
MFNLTCRRTVATSICKYIINEITNKGYCTLTDIVHKFEGDVSKQFLDFYHYDDTSGWDDLNSIMTFACIHLPVSWSEKWCVIEFPDCVRLTLPPKEPVNHPDHYNWDEIIKIFGYEAVVYVDILSAYKYYCCAGNKEGNSKEQDFAKSNNYMSHAAEIIVRCISDTNLEVETERIENLSNAWNTMYNKLKEVKTNEQH